MMWAWTARTEMFAAIDAAGFRVDRVVEPRPLAECRERFPEAWTKLTTRPRFLLFRLSPRQRLAPPL